MLDAEILERLTYCPETGEFRWTVTLNKFARAGAVAGTKDKRGYISIGMKGRHLFAHRIAWFLTYGEWPAGQIDHANGVPHDNRICNLRLATRTQNMANRKIGKNNQSGIKGIYKQGEKWVAKIGVSGKSLYLGIFDTPESAAAAYRFEAQKRFGEFARTA